MKAAGRYVVVSTFPPRTDGIARYADQLARSQDRREMVRVGLPGSTADRVFRLDGDLRPLRLMRATRSADEVVLMWHPDFYISGRVWSRAGAYLALGAVLRVRNVKVVVHEPDAIVPRKQGIHRRLAAGVERAAQRWCWRSPAQFLFHSEKERAEFAKRFARAPDVTVGQVIDHSAHFLPYANATQEEARRLLGLDSDRVIFLCIGFLGRHKGFDRAIQAFQRLPGDSAALYVVGSALYDSADIREHIEALRRLAASVPGVTLIEQFLKDAEFDLWIRAADVLLAPYRSAASSGVVARAKLLGTTVIASRVGGIPEQVGPDGIVIESDEELFAAVARLAGAQGAITVEANRGAQRSLVS